MTKSKFHAWLRKEITRRGKLLSVSVEVEDSGPMWEVLFHYKVATPNSGKSGTVAIARAYYLTVAEEKAAKYLRWARELMS